MVDRPGSWQPEKNGERAKQNYRRDIRRFSVIFAEFTDGWFWSRPSESHHSEPGMNWYGPHQSSSLAEDEADWSAKHRWRLR